MEALPLPAENLSWLAESACCATVRKLPTSDGGYRAIAAWPRTFSCADFPSVARGWRGWSGPAGRRSHASRATPCLLQRSHRPPSNRLQLYASSAHAPPQCARVSLDGSRPPNALSNPLLGYGSEES